MASPPRKVSRAEFARIVGLSAMAITKQLKPGGKLAPAAAGDGVDLSHPAATAYLESHGKKAPPEVKTARAPTRRPPAGAKRSSAPPAPRPGPPKGPVEAPGPGPRITVISDGPENIEDIEQYADMTLREIARRFGSMSAHKEWLEMRKRQVEIQAGEIKNAELKGKLIPRELVRTHVFAAIEEANSRLLNDAAKTITRRLEMLFKSGTSTEVAEVTTRELLSAVLLPVKDKAARVLRKAARQGSKAEGDATQE